MRQTPIVPTVDLRESGPIGAHDSIVNLETVLGAVSGSAVPDRWVAFHWWAVGLDEGVDISDVEPATERGLVLSTDDLLATSRRLLQLIDGVAAVFDGEPPAADDPDLRRTCGLIIQATDSAYWRVYAGDAATLRPLRAIGAEVTDVEDRAMPADPF